MDKTTIDTLAHKRTMRVLAEICQTWLEATGRPVLPSRRENYYRIGYEQACRTLTGEPIQAAEFARRIQTEE